LETWLKIVDGLDKYEDPHASVRALGAAKANQQKGIGDGKVYSPVRLLNDRPELNSGKEGTGIEKAKVWLRMALYVIKLFQLTSRDVKKKPLTKEALKDWWRLATGPAPFTQNAFDFARFRALDDVQACWVIKCAMFWSSSEIPKKDRQMATYVCLFLLVLTLSLPVVTKYVSMAEDLNKLLTTLRCVFLRLLTV
jgi:hypothetical protein